jgi:biopolymer transport protein ExbD
MKFQRHSTPEPEINLIPFIDVLLVVLIFLMLTTTYSKFTELQINLPVADAQNPPLRAKEIWVTLNAQGQVSVQRNALGRLDASALANALGQAAQGLDDPVLVISADARTPHQYVVNVMEAARQNNLGRMTFVTQTGGAARK